MLANSKVDWEAVGICAGVGAVVGGVAAGAAHGITNFINGAKATKSISQYPGNDASKCPGKGFEWRGNGDPSSGKGSWYNPKTGEILHPDLSHGEPIGPHWDYTSPTGEMYRWFPDGTFSLK